MPRQQCLATGRICANNNELFNARFESAAILPDRQSGTVCMPDDAAGMHKQSLSLAHSHLLPVDHVSRRPPEARVVMRSSQQDGARQIVSACMACHPFEEFTVAKLGVCPLFPSTLLLESRARPPKHVFSMDAGRAVARVGAQLKAGPHGHRGSAPTRCGSMAVLFGHGIDGTTC